MENTLIKKPIEKVLRGVVTSNKMEKTIVVAVESRKRHPIYKKFVTSTKTFKAHDENNVAGIGDTVDIIETRHISRDKYFRLLTVVEKAK